VWRIEPGALHVDCATSLARTVTHGTSVDGIISAVCDNGIGVCGVAPDAKIVNVKVAPSDAREFPISRTLEAFDWVSSVGKSRYGVRIVNFSDSVVCHDTDPSCRDEVVHLYKIANRMLALVHKRGLVIFATAGNQGVNVSQDESFKAWPAKDSPHTVTVGATGPCNAAGDGNVQNDFYDNLAVYSNFGVDQNESRYVVMPGGQRPEAARPARLYGVQRNQCGGTPRVGADRAFALALPRPRSRPYSQPAHRGVPVGSGGGHRRAWL
jgi:subtilisin family serine protease